MMRILIWVARLAGAGAMLLGWLYLVFQLDVLVLHITLGITLALAMAGLGLGLLRYPAGRALGAAVIGYALFTTAFGSLQASLLVGPLHGLIQGLHLLLGLGAVGLVQWVA